MATHLRFLDSADQRIVHAKRREAAEIAIAAPQLADAVAEADGGDAGVVDLRSGNAACDGEIV